MGTERQLPQLYVVASGSPIVERFMITNQEDEFWNGQQFARIPALYARHNDAASDLVNILKSHFAGVPPVKYVVPLIVEVYSDDPLHVTEIPEHLSKASRLYVNTTTHGHGPGKSLVVPTIHWDQIEELANE